MGRWRRGGGLGRACRGGRRGGSLADQRQDVVGADGVAFLEPDLRENARRNYGNHLRLHRFEGDPEDRELRDVLPFLDWLREQENFRTIEKRNWRDGGWK